MGFVRQMDERQRGLEDQKEDSQARSGSTKRGVKALLST
jgi:hypothetical protein